MPDYVSRVGSPYQENGVVVGKVICDVAGEDIRGFRPVAECIQFNGEGDYEEGDEQVRLIYANYEAGQNLTAAPGLCRPKSNGYSGSRSPRGRSELLNCCRSSIRHCDNRSRGI